VHRSFFIFAIFGAMCAFVVVTAVHAQSTDASQRDFRFDGKVSRRVLKNYLSRAITESDLLTGKGNFQDNLRMLVNVGAKFAGRTIYRWGGEDRLPVVLERAQPLVEQIHQADPEIVLQAAIFEVVSKSVNILPVPEWVFSEFGLPEEKRNFRYESMIYSDGYGLDKFGKDRSVPDITQQETQLFFYYLGRSYIDLGIEAIHCGQIKLMARNDSHLSSWFNLLGRLRKYAASHARRHFVFFDGHAPDHGFADGGRLLLDFHSFPSRPVELVKNPEQTFLQKGHLDTIYGRSMGGLTPSGWKCTFLPYLVELDNGKSTDRQGQPNVNGGYAIWGYDEISWFAHQSRDYRNYWLRYAAAWLRKNDWDGFFEMPGSRPLSAPVGDRSYYFANSPSAAFPQGFGQEDTIKDIFLNLDHP
jgi:hypothetical protein